MSFPGIHWEEITKKQAIESLRAHPPLSIQCLNNVLGQVMKRKHLRAIEQAKGYEGGVDPHKLLNHRRYVTLLKALGLKDVLLFLQGNKCLICKKPFSSSKPSVIDHCHDTGVIRGALHSGCNTSLGIVGDNLQNVQKYSNYLERSQCLVRRPGQRKLKTLNYAKAERAHFLSILRGVAYRDACELVWRNPDTLYADEVQDLERRTRQWTGNPSLVLPEEWKLA